MRYLPPACANVMFSQASVSHSVGGGGGVEGWGYPLSHVLSWGRYLWSQVSCREWVCPGMGMSGWGGMSRGVPPPGSAAGSLHLRHSTSVYRQLSASEAIPLPPLAKSRIRTRELTSIIDNMLYSNKHLYFLAFSINRVFLSSHMKIISKRTNIPYIVFSSTDIMYF